jgi:mannose-6-phosphate isomerase-like protein (cupin superfamily)
MSTVPLRVAGQCVFVFDYKGTKPCSFTFRREDGSNVLQVDWTAYNISVRGITPCIDIYNNSGLINISEAYYWFSLDAQNGRLYAGIGEPRLETAIYSYKFPEHFHKSNKGYLEQIKTLSFGPDIHIRMHMTDPISTSIPFTVKDMDDLTMDDIARGTYMPIVNLSPTTQKLYNCIAGKKFILDDKDFPDFSKAIQRSIVTPGAWCNTMLAKKAQEFGKPNPKETYLRITLGENGGESPGIPYVMEIWPAGNYSPVHSHAGANAIIRVLHGSIQVNLYPYLSKKVLPFKTADFKKNDVTWISPTLNQTHQLRNITNELCVTIQCYMYEENDRGHYDYFDYLDSDGVQQQYEPDSDMDFVSFKRAMRKEWDTRRT